MKKAKYKIIGVRPASALLDPHSDEETYILTYLIKPWYLFGKTKKVEYKVTCPDYKRDYWLKSINDKIQKGDWRKP